MDQRKKPARRPIPTWVIADVCKDFRSNLERFSETGNPVKQVMLPEKSDHNDPANPGFVVLILPIRVLKKFEQLMGSTFGEVGMHIEDVIHKPTPQSN